MSRSAREVWEERVRRLGESDLTIGEFAAELGINAHTLSYWKWVSFRQACVGAPEHPLRNLGGHASGDTADDAW